MLVAAGLAGSRTGSRAALSNERKRNASVSGISQSLEDFVGSRNNPRAHGATIMANEGTKIVGQQPGDATPLAEH
jgi:hypothetical protein